MEVQRNTDGDTPSIPLGAWDGCIILLWHSLGLEKRTLARCFCQFSIKSYAAGSHKNNLIIAYAKPCARIGFTNAMDRIKDQER